MLLTLHAGSLKGLLRAGRGGKASKLDVLDLPAYARERLGLHGLCLTTDLLAGAEASRLDAMRDRADKARCACLLLIEPGPLALADASEDKAAGAIERAQRVVRAAQLLGCSGAAFTIQAKDTEDAFENAVDRLKSVIASVDRMEVNVLISPAPGLTGEPERVTELIKRVGGFRIGTFPDFQSASKTPDGVVYLRRLVPYASVVCASTQEFEGDDPTRHKPYDLAAYTKTVVSVGFDGMLALDYRGAGDATLGLELSRKALEGLLGQEPVEP